MNIKTKREGWGITKKISTMHRKRPPFELNLEKIMVIFLEMIKGDYFAFVKKKKKFSLIFK